jgi:sigma-E factor negative regulatory protein RseA
MTSPKVPPPPAGSLQADDCKRCMSAFVDGQSWALPEAMRLWREQGQAREAWHTYHLIGDAMRSEELARPVQHDAAFLQALRQRLAVEPVPLVPPVAVNPVSPVAVAVADVPQLRPVSAGAVPAVPTHAEAAPPSRQRWLMPAAAAAGVAMVAGVLVVGRMGVPAGGATPAVAAASDASALSRVSLTRLNPPTTASASTGSVPALTALPAAGPDGVIRDPRLEEFLRAHQAARSGFAAGVPGSALRRVDAVVGTVQPAAAK